MSHSCGHHTIDEHFENKGPQIRELFEVLVKVVRRFGPVHVYAQKINDILLQEYQMPQSWVEASERHQLLYTTKLKRLQY